VNKQYYYHGELMFEVKGANIYDSPTVAFKSGKERADLIPVDVDEMLRRNNDQMFLIENEAIEFIRDTYIAYAGVNQAYDSIKANQNIDFEALAQKVEKKTKQKMAVVKEDCDSFDVMPLDVANAEGKRVLLSTRIDRFIASFSGGKDSQVVLDLVTRAIPPTAFEVIYSDTGYELPSSLDLYEDVKRHYCERFPALKFSLVRNHESVLNYWDKIGWPSDTHRWCCSVMKTVPLYMALKVEENKQAKVMAFEGVRVEESVKRNNYNRIGKGVKHSFVINARPILFWNTTEIFLYLLLHSLPINMAYRYGKPRVGCIFCPFGSPWDDMIVNHCYKEELRPFLSRIEDNVAKRKIPNAEEYIKERRWKLRASGTNLGNKTEVQIKSSSTEFIAIIINPQKSIIDWLPALGRVSLNFKNDISSGIFSYEKNNYNFTILNLGNNKVQFCVSDNNNIRLRFYLRRILFKASYCINCESCEIECPTGALSTYPTIKINPEQCIHCFKCLDYHQHGCIVADSLVTTMGNEKNTSKISAYGTFGIQEAWVDEFLSDPESFWKDNSLGVKQVPSFKAWLKDAEVIDETGCLTRLGVILSAIREDSNTLLWEIIHINLCYNNPLMKWFVQNVQFSTQITRKELESLILDYFNSSFKPTTITYALQALLQVFKYSPIGTDFGQLEAIDSKNTTFFRRPYNDLSIEAIAYSIYRFAESTDIDMIRVSDLYKSDVLSGVYKEFGISKNELLKQLRSLHADPNRVLTAELNMGLDHISLRKDLTSISVLELLTK
ncbi:MAG: phosphoadenosine phosphosulfate reductase family protein, partial [Prevotella sp.]|nr:phosphoadenosine phosphosulfate reductase family protein [Prevotella sp.]